MPDAGKLILIIGLVIALIGLLIMLGLPLGRLPGDIVYRRDNTTIYVPLVTSLVLSILLTLIFMFLRR